jgi:hypothetical protein
MVRAPLPLSATTTEFDPQVIGLGVLASAIGLPLLAKKAWTTIHDEKSR